MLTLKNTTRSGENGFTLIELVIVVAIMAILASIALPAYNDSISKTRRADGQGALMGFANAMERHFTTNGTYLGAGTEGTDGTTTGPSTVFSTSSPVDGSAVYYNLEIQAATGSTYTLVAEAAGAQNGNGDMRLTSTGLRSWDRGSDGFGASDNCWDKTC
jgi:type IV pilus assembly protein PilE